MTKTDRKLQEIIGFFESEDGYEKDEVISDILEDIKELRPYFADEIILHANDTDLIALDDFAKKFYDEVIKGVCNVIKSFRSDADA